MSTGKLSAPCKSLLCSGRIFATSITNKFSTESKALPTKIFEVRVYNGHPQDFKKAVNLINEYLHFRIKYSKLFGFWTTELGSSIFQMLHIWEYDSLNHRLQARKNLLQDKVWQTEFLPQLLPFMQTMDNFLVAPISGSTVNVDFKNDLSAVYELQTLKRNGKHSVPAKSSGNGDILVGTFRGVFGSTDTEYRLWRYPNVDTAFTESWNRSEAAPQKGSSLLLYPAKVSPIS
ncbi:unnamed protein product [Candidula unifasciata]|uniref:NIPSNAP domain-containing protein n=1 Tax=Candidula unifasciata TaxID=100452 RepID=A0A8S3ZQY7_9EUPU|nr:unnamed protein product [Candidula unifasciata]